MTKESLLDQLVERLTEETPERKANLIEMAKAATGHLKFIPNPGPQTDAFHCKADILLYGGAGGGGKSACLLGLALTQHRCSLIMRRHYTDLGAITREAIALNGTRDGFNGSSPPRLMTTDGRLIEFGAANKVGDEEQWQGQAHDFIGFDEGAQFAESQVRFVIGWLRSADPNQRCRVVIASNPPMSAEGEWLISFFRPWLDITHPNPAKPGELRWFITDEMGQDMEVPSGDMYQLGDRLVKPISRSFIPASVGDNPFYAGSNYEAVLDSMQEPMRSAIRDGNFMMGRRDQLNQVMPTDWIRQAQARWTPDSPKGIPQCAMACDIAQGGHDETTVAMRYDGWFAPIVAVPGAETPNPSSIVGLLMSLRTDASTMVLDMGGGYGGGPLENLQKQGLGEYCFAYKGGETSTARTKDGQFGFYNKRSQAYWQFREALDPTQPGGSAIRLPDDQRMLADLTAPTFEIVTLKGKSVIKILEKDEVCKILGRSPDRGDAVVMCWFKGAKAATHAREGGNWGTGRTQRQTSANQGRANARRH